MLLSTVRWEQHRAGEGKGATAATPSQANRGNSKAGRQTQSKEEKQGQVQQRSQDDEANAWPTQKGFRI